MPRTHPEVGGKLDNGDKETVTVRSGTPEKQKFRSRRVNQSVGCQKREEAQTERHYSLGLSDISPMLET